MKTILIHFAMIQNRRFLYPKRIKTGSEKIYPGNKNQIQFFISGSKYNFHHASFKYWVDQKACSLLNWLTLNGSKSNFDPSIEFFKQSWVVKKLNLISVGFFRWYYWRLVNKLLGLWRNLLFISTVFNNRIIFYDAICHWVTKKVRNTHLY